MTRYLIAAILLILIGYGAVEARPLLLGPSLTISSPVETATTTSQVLTVSGHAYRTIALSLDGAPVLPDQDGSFSSTVTLPRGGSILTLTAVDRFGRSISKTRTVFVP